MFELDRYGFPTIHIPLADTDVHVHFLPVTRSQFEFYLADHPSPGMDMEWYDARLKDHPRVDPGSVDEKNYAGLFTTGLRPFEAHPGADEGRDQLLVVIGIFLPDVILDTATGEPALSRSFESLEHDLGGDPIAEPDRAMERHGGFRMEPAEPRPTKLHGRQTRKDEARWRDQRAIDRLRSVLGIDPQGIVVADALGKSEDGHPIGHFVVDEPVRADFGADPRPHVRQHLVGEGAAGQFFRNLSVGVHGESIGRAAWPREPVRISEHWVVSTAATIPERHPMSRLVGFRSRGGSSPSGGLQELPQQREQELGRLHRYEGTRVQNLEVPVRDG